MRKIQGQTCLAKYGKLNYMRGLKLFLWRALAGVLPTKSILCNRLGRGDNICSICGKEKETLVHLFYSWDFVRKLAFASLWRIRYDMVAVSNIDDAIDLCINSTSSLHIVFHSIDECALFFACPFDPSWCFRTDRLFQGQTSFDDMVQLLNYWFKEFSFCASYGVRRFNRER